MVKHIENLSNKELRQLEDRELTNLIRPVFQGAEEKRRWREVDNEVKIINGKKSEFIKEDEFSFIADYIWSCWVNQK
ncbi:hypothetical protein FACS1894192_00620 [Bacilli bacterium]|nr:hypothetical protein FACS1894192_00620 [Bacilli bacterium]